MKPTSRAIRRALPILLATIALALLEVAAGAAATDSGTEPAARRPNVVVLMTDDQTQQSLRFMPNVNRLLAGEGMTFANSFASYPLCCPSRVTYLTGQYAHNHGVLFNSPPTGGYANFRDQDTTFPVALQRAGYRTIHIGKYLNGYGRDDPTEVPPGWDDWHGSVDPTSYYYFGFTLNDNGKLHEYGRRVDDYQTDVYADLAAVTIADAAPREEPFYLNVAFTAPHAAVPEVVVEPRPDIVDVPTPAPRHEGTFFDEPLPRPPSFNEADASDKPGFVAGRPMFGPKVATRITESYRRQLETLQAVDDAVGDVVRALRQQGELENTVIVFTSDNGFFYGEHRIQFGKFYVYEPSVRVPLVIRGPGFERDVTSESLVSNVDLAPTILDLTGVDPLREVDGRSLVPLLEGASLPELPVLLESGVNTNRRSPVYHAIRTPEYVYVEYALGERELYDLQADPDQLQNLAADPALESVRADLAARLAALKDCAGRECSAR